MERPHEVGKIREADIESHIGNRTTLVGEQSRRVAEARTDEVLVRGHSENAGEHAQEVEAAETDFPRSSIEIDRFVRVRIDP